MLFPHPLIAPGPMDTRNGFRLGDRTVEPPRNRITGPDGTRHVEPKVMEVLRCLVDGDGQVVSRERITHDVWGHEHVSDQALTSCISEIRRALGDDRADPRFIETVPKRGYRLIAPVQPLEPAESMAVKGFRSAWGHRIIAGIVVLMAGGLLYWWLGTGSGGDAGESRSVAVLPFEKLHEGGELDYLRLALPDEVTTILSHTPTLAVRPFDPTSSLTPVEAAGAQNAAIVVTGHFYLAGEDRLNIAIEALKADANTILWRTQFRTPADDVLALRRTLSSKVREELIPSMGAGRAKDAGNQPADAQAYRLYLQSLAVSRDPGRNLRGIEMLERATTLDPEFAPAWATLSARYYDAAEYGEGGDRALADARLAAERALDLDPGLLSAARQLIVLQTESGDLQAAFHRASGLVERYPDNAQAHFALAYVYRYGGMLDASQEHCEAAVRLDPHNYRWRSCAFPYMAAGELEQAKRFIDLDTGSYWANLVTALYWMRKDAPRDALENIRRLASDAPTRNVLAPCLQGRTGEALDAPTRIFMDHWTQRRDPEVAYWSATELAYCGRVDDAFRLLEHAIDGNYCSYPAVDRDPIWEAVRKRPAFRQLREAALACHQDFKASISADQ